MAAIKQAADAGKYLFVFFSKTNDDQTLAMRKDRFDKLPVNIQKAVLEAATEAEVYGNQLDEAMSEKARAYAASLGVQTYTPTDQEMQQWRSTGRSIWKDYEGKVDKDLLKMVLDSQSKG